MRIAVLTTVFLLASASAVAQIGDVEVPDPTGGLPSPEVQVPAMPAPPIPQQEPEEQEEPPEDSQDPEQPPRDYQTILWEDGAAAPIPDSFDLRSLRMWEANLMVDPADPTRPSGGGFMMRLQIAGSNPDGGYDRHVIAGGLYRSGDEAGPAVPITFELMDDESSAEAGAQIWVAAESHVHLISQTTTAGAAIIPDVLSEPADHVLHFFVPLSALAAEPGDTVSGWSFVTQSFDSEAQLPSTQFDSAPDGSFLIRNADDVANASVEQRNGSADYFVQGAGHHLNVTGLWSEGTVSMTIHNPYQWPQHVVISYPEGATPTTVTEATLAGNQSMAFGFAAPKTEQARTLMWDVRSDIHALAQMSLSLPAAPPPPPAPSPSPSQPAPSQPAPSEPEEDIVLDRTDIVVSPPDSEQPQGDEPPIVESKDSPAGAWLALVAVAAAMLYVRRRS